MANQANSKLSLNDEMPKLQKIPQLALLKQEIQILTKPQTICGDFVLLESLVHKYSEEDWVKIQNCFHEL